MYGIGLDIGTTSVCGILVNAVSGEIVKSITESNDGFVALENPVFKEQDASKLVNKLKNILDTLLEEGKDVKAIGITGQMHGIVYLDYDGKPVSNLKIWQDGRGELPYKDGHTYVSYMSAVTGYPLATGYGAVTYFYDKENGLVPKEAVSFCTVHDLAAITLCSKAEPVTHISDGASLGLYDVKSNSFDKDAIEKLGLSFDVFPKVISDTEIIGEYKGIPVSVAIGDNQASFIGSVCDMENSLLINMGTGGQISCLTGSVPEGKDLDCRPLLNNSYILAGSSLCGGRAYALLEKLFREIAREITGTEVKSAYPSMDRIMADYAPTSSPLNVNTLFSGSRSEPDKRGSIENVGTDNLSMASLCDGFMVGMANELYHNYEKMLPCISGKKALMIGSGNGIRFNSYLKKRFEDVFSMPMLIPAQKEEAAFGACLFSLASAGVFESVSDAQKLIKYL